ncbi:MAG: rhomboid family intramembrane serine protease [Candidatus Izemoplasmatales bacterium]|nr:rhomboid family intramembrane serine protease [Candidatus Izemoplasmatales bacterium]
MNKISFDQKLLLFIKKSPVTATLMILNLLMLLVTYIVGGFENDVFVKLGGLAPILITDTHEYYRLLTSMFLHASLLHFLSNMLALYLLGIALEKTMGPVRFTLLYFISGLGASVAIVLFAEPLRLTIGASGAIYGIVGSLLYITFARPLWFTPQSVRSIRYMIVLNLFITVIVPNVSIAGHIGGLIVGVLLSFILMPKKPYFTRFIREYNNGYETVNNGDDYTVS